MAIAKPKKLTFAAPGATTNFVSHRCIYWGFRVGMDAANDPTITLYDNASTGSGLEVEPTNTYDATALGANGANMGVGVLCENGITGTVAIAAGSCEITVYYS
ncbi:MAG: hypothetical protein BV459_09005 [Thermoplasmata archaeon M11B2D]|nr:MAG: hypothetical protein BV459_09005 [Thermoplasmata archaeon M11B2D]